MKAVFIIFTNRADTHIYEPIRKLAYEIFGTLPR